MTEQQGVELIQALVESSMLLPQAVTDPETAAQVVAKLKNLMNQQASESKQEASWKKPNPEVPEKSDESPTPLPSKASPGQTG